MPVQRLELAKYRYVAGVQRSHGLSVTASPTSTRSEEKVALKSRSGTPDAQYPIGDKVRAKYRNASGKPLTPYQWKVYDHVLTIPAGKVSTYKTVALTIGGSPRSVGTALRHNPFSPYVPCHRVIASNLFIGGFCGEWSKVGEPNPTIQRKRSLLAEEGVYFDHRDCLCERDQLLT